MNGEKNPSCMRWLHGAMSSDERASVAEFDVKE
jgi:hypothetical protein